MRLDEAVTFLDHLRQPVTASERVVGSVPYYGANGQQDSVADFIFDEPLVLLAEDGGNFNEPDKGVAYVIRGRSWVNNHAHVLRPKDHVDVGYLGRVLENYSLAPYISGSTRGKLTKANAMRIPIPLPPLPEQRRIAAILDQVDNLHVRRLATIASLQALDTALFNDMFGDPLLTSREPGATPLGERVTSIIDCPHTTPAWTTKGVMCLRTPNLAAGEWDFTETRYVSEETHAKRTIRGELAPGDLVLSREGTIGTGAIVTPTMRVSMGQRMVQIKPDKRFATSEFLLAYLLQVFKPQRLHKLLVGSTVQHLNVGDIRRLPILVPPLAEQGLFADRHGAIRRAITVQRAHLAKLDELFASLQHRAFNGEL